MVVEGDPMSDVYLRRQYGGDNLALYVKAEYGDDDYAIPFLGRVRRSRKSHKGDCGHQICDKQHYFDVRSPSLPGRAVRYCTVCLSHAEGARWDWQDDDAIHEETMGSMTDDEIGGF